MKEDYIIKRCQEGDIDAFKQIYFRYERPMLSTAIRMIGTREKGDIKCIAQPIKQRILLVPKLLYRNDWGILRSTTTRVVPHEQFIIKQQIPL